MGLRPKDITCRMTLSCYVMIRYCFFFVLRLTIKVRNTEATSPGQIVWVVMTYKPPAQVTTDLFDSKLNATGDWDLYNRMVNWPRSKL